MADGQPRAHGLLLSKGRGGGRGGGRGLACGPGSPELSKSYMDMASKLFTFTLTLEDTSVSKSWLKVASHRQAVT